MGRNHRRPTGKGPYSGRAGTQPLVVVFKHLPPMAEVDLELHESIS